MNGGKVENINMAEELANAARMLSHAATRLGTNHSSSESQSSLSRLTALPECSTTSATTTSRADNELHTMFPHHFTSTSSTSSNSLNRGRSAQRKRKRNGNQIQVSKAKTVIRKFFCLADKEQLESPDREEQRDLLSAGLGESKVSVPHDASEKDVRDLLIKTFPKLKEAGGFELMYVETRRRELMLIPIGPDGLSMKYLTSFIGQGKIFVRPIQQDLSFDNQESMLPSGHKEKCKNCLAIVDINLLRQHSTICPNSNCKYILYLLIHCNYFLFMYCICHCFMKYK